MTSEPQQDQTEDAEFDIESNDVEQEAMDPIDALRQELDEAVAAKQRAMADFSNFQRRSTENENRARCV